MSGLQRMRQCPGPIPAPAPDNAISGRARNFTFAALSSEFWILYEIFDCCRIDLSLCWATNSPQLMITMFILCDGWRVATMPKRIEDVEMVTTETDREARGRERWCRRRIDNNSRWMEGGTGVCCRDSKARQATKLLLCFSYYYYYYNALFVHQISVTNERYGSAGGGGQAMCQVESSIDNYVNCLAECW